MNFNGQFLNETNDLYVGMALDNSVVVAKVDKARSFGEAVSLAKGDHVKEPLYFTIGDAAENKINGILINDINYGSKGQLIPGFDTLVLTNGRVVVEIAAADSGTMHYGDPLYYDVAAKNFTKQNKANCDAGHADSEPFKAKKVKEDGSIAVVDAVVVKFNK